MKRKSYERRVVFPLNGESFSEKESFLFLLRAYIYKYVFGKNTKDIYIYSNDSFQKKALQIVKEFI